MLLSNLDVLATAPGGVARLRELILTLAVQGKLVAQDPADEPAGVLLQKIRAEKDSLIAEGKIKRDKPLAEIGDEEKPFELPQGWEWVRVGQVSARVQYGITASADHASTWPRFVRITDIQKDRVNWETVPGVQGQPEDFADHYLMPGDLLIARTGGTIGKSFLVPNVQGEAVFASYLIRITPIAGLQPSYLKVFASSGHYWDQLREKSMGTGQPNVNGTALSLLSLPLPPLAEQSRIVTRVEALMRLCDALEAKGQLEAAQHAQLVSTLLALLVGIIAAVLITRQITGPLRETLAVVERIAERLRCAFGMLTFDLHDYPSNFTIVAIIATAETNVERIMFDFKFFMYCTLL